MDAPRLAGRGAPRVQDRRAARPGPAMGRVSDERPSKEVRVSLWVSTSWDPGLPGSPWQHELATPRLSRTCNGWRTFGGRSEERRTRPIYWSPPDVPE